MRDYWRKQKTWKRKKEKKCFYWEFGWGWINCLN